MAKLFAFDIDGTLTLAREQIDREMVSVLRDIIVKHHIQITFITGSDPPLLQDQLVRPLYNSGIPFNFSLPLYASNGCNLYTIEPTGSVTPVQLFSLSDKIGQKAHRALLSILRSKLNKTMDLLGWTSSGLKVIGEQVVDRGSMINLTPIGRTIDITDEIRSNRKAFAQFDKRTSFRKVLARELSRLNFVLPYRNLVFSIGGQTSVDIGYDGMDKSFAIKDLVDRGHKDIYFFGDALHKGGNDEPILKAQSIYPRILKPIKVSCPQDTISQISSIIG